MVKSIAAGVGTLLASAFLFCAGAALATFFAPVWSVLAGAIAVPLLVGSRRFGPVAIVCVVAFLVIPTILFIGPGGW